MSRLLIILLLFSLVSTVQAKSPKAPNPRLTPGVLCDEDDRDFWRTFNNSGEDVAICKRNVSMSTKYQVLARYGINKKLRKQYKIDHFIPLNIGGSNHIDNLFPIDKELMGVYERPEWPVYQAYRNGILTQSEAVKFVYDWKSNSYDYYWAVEHESELLEWEEQFPNIYLD